MDRPRVKARYGSRSEAFECPICGRDHPAFQCSQVDITEALKALDNLHIQLDALPALRPVIKQRAGYLLENAEAAIRSLYTLVVGP
jgi:hypothetical protein